jgi:transposase
MICIGIDVAKNKHDCHIATSEGKVLCDNFSFANSREGFSQFLQATVDFEKIKVGIESTGHYSSNLLSFLSAQGFEVVVFNPLSVNRLRTAGSLRKTKTDKNDARYIARLLMTEDNNPYQEQSYHIQVLKSLTRARYRLVKEITPLKNRYKRLVHLLFPEIDGFFCNIYTNTALSLFSKLGGAHDIAGCGITKLTAVLSQASKGRFKKDKALSLKELAQTSIGCGNIGDSCELKLTAQRIMFLEVQKSCFEQEISNLMKSLNSPITSIPGIGEVLGATILSEIGDIHSFATPAKLLAFAGCEPSTYQSGQYVSTKTPMVKRGSRYLRNALYLATNAAFLHSHTFRSYINRKRGQGKHFYTAMSHGMKKLTRVIFAVLKNNSAYKEPI